MSVRVGWRTELSPYRVENAERRVGTKLRRSPVGKGFKLSKGCIDALNDGRKARASVNAQRKLLAALTEGAK